jgi:hypothetical protein
MGTAHSVTVSNSGTADLTISSAAISGTHAADFAKSADTCFGATVVPSGTCTVSVTFTPAATGSRSAALTLTSNAPGSPHTVNLTGTGVQPEVSLSTVSLSFGDQQVGSTSTGQSVTLSNSGSATLNITGIAHTGDFGHTTTCGSTLASGANCTINVTFAPTSRGSRTGTLTLTSDAPGSPHTVNLSGNGIGPAASLSSSILTFVAQVVNTTSPAQTVTLTNIGETALSISSIAVSGDFAQTHTCGSSVAAGANCTISVTFTPMATGSRSGSLTITDDAAGSPHTVALSGQGTDFSLSSNLTSSTVTAGQAATFALGVTPISGFNQSVALTCTKPESLSLST